MTTDLLRVVVVSREPEWVTTLLRSKVPGCLPVSVPSVEDVAPELRPEAIVLLDLGDDDASFDAARQLRQAGVGHGILVIGTSTTDELPGLTGLQPPFLLTDLMVAMEEARQHSIRATSAEGSEGAPGSPDETRDAPAAPSAIAPEPAPAPTAPATSAPSPPPAPPPARPTSASDESRATARPAGPQQDREGTTPSPVPAPAVTEQPRVPTPVRRSPSTAVPQVAREAVASADESLFTGKSPAPSPGTASDRDGPAEPLRARMDRWRRRLSAHPAEDPSGPSERDLHERLVQIFAASSQIESIAAELPSVVDPAALYEAIVMTVADEFAADTVALWRRAHNGWVAVAHRGLSGRGASLPVGFDQPVLHDVDARAGAILLDPTGSFLSLVSGISGAHTTSFMASSVAVGSHRIGVLAVGRDEPLVETDLDRLVELAVEAAVGIGVADHIQRMSSLAGREEGVEFDRVVEPGQWREELLDELETAWRARHEGNKASDPATDAGMWSALDTSRDAEASGGAGGERMSADEPEVVIDLNSRATKQR